MTLSQIIRTIASTPEFQSNPPILVDIGASGKLNSLWTKIAPLSICIAFDADTGGLDYIKKSASAFKQHYVFNKIVVSSSDKAKQPFYLTQNPYCSSLLKPDSESLKGFHISHLFEIKQVVELDVIELQTLLEQLGIKAVDWFKTDSQGTDLRLYESLSEEQQNKILVLEFEPGFMDAYLGEDKIIDVMNYMRSRPFFLTSFTIRGALRIPYNSFVSIFRSKIAQKLATRTHKTTPGWGEMVYMNNLNHSSFTKREYMLAWLFATLQHHHDVAYTYSHKASERFDDCFFDELTSFSKRKLKNYIYSFNSMVKVLEILLRKYYPGS